MLNQMVEQNLDLVFHALGDPTRRAILARLAAGEATVGPASGALANAVFAATGLRVRDLPMTPDRLRRVAAGL